MVTVNMQGLATPPLDGVREGRRVAFLTGDLSRTRFF
jgi:hypothetical protein